MARPRDPAGSTWAKVAAIATAAGTLMTALAAVGALYFTNSTLSATNEQLGLTRRTAQSEQIKSAAEQLDSDKTSVRLSGIYLLERLTQDSEPDRPALRRLLEAFIRTEAPSETPSSSFTCGPHNRELPADIQAALAVIVKYSALPLPTPGVDLHMSCLTGAELSGADLTEAGLFEADLTGARLDDANLTEVQLFDTDLTEATLYRANLTRARLDRANLTGALLSGANLTRATLFEADLTGAQLPDADLTGAQLPDANLTGARLDDANLTGATLFGADLTGAILDGADLTGAILDGADLTEIAYDDSTVWPEGFTPPASA
ncbi:pentapeptide repeat-containing protein [Nocardia sp. NBC_00416]|uniref:pentapeptide repeat-containing protein n=1 Tax=Nocardia sp. NBC_00416 TaxID=2975991 RepID=UPI002E1E3F03